MTRETPYTSDEQRVSEYIQEMTDGMIGSGDDPIGFLIASHAHYKHLYNTITEQVAVYRKDMKDIQEMIVGLMEDYAMLVKRAKELGLVQDQ